jgi:predicted DCC family thiol-disulfide oxidoreductase YuxK
MSAKKHSIIYDDKCNLCSNFIGFVRKNMNAEKLNFIPFNSPIIYELIKTDISEIKDMRSIIYIRGNKIMMKSKAILYIFREMKKLWPCLYLFIIIPRFIRDGIYDFIAKNRYKWFGRTACTCQI